MNKKYKILTFFLIHFCFLNNALAEVKVENIAPIIVDNNVPAITDSNQSKTVIDSKIDASMTGYYVNPNEDKASLNNFAIGVSFGKKIDAKNLINFSQKYSEYLKNKFLLAELFYNKNIIKNSKNKSLKIDSLQGLRLGFGGNYDDFNLALTSNIFTTNSSSNSSNNYRNLYFLFGVSGGYKLNKNFDLKCNIISSFGQKIKNFRNNFNNFDISMAFNF
jgi:outer membrane receptor for monomeric catechols